MKLEEMTSREFAQKVNDKSVVILPIGSIEEHGPHLPLSTDCIQPMHVAERVAKKTGAFIAPFLYYGVCNTTRHYPGTLSVSFEALRLTVRDILSELVRNGFRNIVVLTGHDGQDHVAALRMAAREVVRESKVRILVFSDYDILYRGQLLPQEDGHAGMGETSRIMAERPKLVKKRPPAAGNKMPDYAILDDARPYWTGWTGDPGKASAALGRKLDDKVVEETVRLIRGMKRLRVR
jgi:creatinine amidohydrolase